jgi:hypothetical protein
MGRIIPYIVENKNWLKPPTRYTMWFLRSRFDTSPRRFLSKPRIFENTSSAQLYKSVPCSFQHATHVINIMSDMCLSENGVYLSNRNFNEENSDKPVDLGVPNFQTNIDIINHIFHSWGRCQQGKNHLDQLFLASSGSNASSIQHISGKKTIRTPSGMHRPMKTATYPLVI